MNNPTVKFVTFEDFNARVGIGSSKIRAKWLCNQWPEASIHKFGDDADVFIYQKVYWVEHAQVCNRIKILDLCDADWLSWGYRIKEMIDNCDGVTCNTEKTAQFISKITDKPVIVVPDRIDYNSLPEKRAKHEGDAKTAVWYGYSNNFTMLNSAVESLIKTGFEKLIVVADKPYGLPSRLRDKLELTNYPYTEENAHKDIQRADVCLNPQFGTGKWQFKSNNKSIISLALGVPVAHTVEELEKYSTAEVRNEAIEQFEKIKDEFDVKRSIEEIKGLINFICLQKEKEIK